MKRRKNIKKCLIFCAYIVLCFVSSLFFASAADDQFEKEISVFPESYKPYLRTLHQEHPQWKFEPFNTGLDWQEAVDNQFGAKSTISNSSEASDIFKSKSSGHYDYSTGKYIDLDSGFAAANKLAIEYYMDPRNFLNDKSIFMFDKLSFSEDYTISSVETVLKGTFMYDTIITYYDSSGTMITTDEKYSEVIYQAGKTYNVNPCYLASKIKIEVGGGTSGSVTGKHKTYPGIYNFYNIGANDGADPVSNGLKYASSGTSFMRPWNSPYKSIMGGAQFIANTYISKGQDTSYLQRFNVNKNSSFPIYTHQYMTNIMATHAQVYQTYNSYNSAGLVDGQWVFSIPVFSNMPGESLTDQSAQLLESSNQYGTISISACNVRTGPSTNNSRKTDNSGANIKLYEGTPVKIIQKVVTDSDYYTNILSYPVWYKISFTYNSVSYIGYVPEGFVNIITYSNVNVGEYDINAFKSDSDVDVKLISNDINIAEVVDNNTVKFLKQGNVEIVAYNSSLMFDRLLFNVSDEETSVSGLSVKPDKTGITVSVDENNNAQNYGFYLADSEGNMIKQTEQEKNTYTFTSLESNKKYTVYVRYVLESGKKYGETSAVSVSTLDEDRPQKPTGMSLSNITNTSYRISWNAVADATGYRVYKYDIAQKKYVVIGNTTQTYMDFTGLSYGDKCGYKVRAYKKGTSSYLYSEYSDILWAATKPAAVENLNVVSFTSSACKLEWGGSVGATHYYLYLVSPDGKYTQFATSKTNSYNVKALKEFTDYSFSVSAVVKNGTCITESEKSGAVSIKTAFSPVKNVKVNAESFNKIKLSWEATQGAERYEVYVYEGNSESYSYKLETSKNSLLVTGLKEFSNYRFTVKSVRTIDNRVYTSEESSFVNAQTILPVVSGFSASSVTKSSYRINWKTNQFATSYNVYKKSGSSYVKIATVKTNYYDVASVGISTVDFYKVSAVRKVENAVYESKLSSEFSASTLPDKVKNVKTTVGSVSAVLKWDKVKDAACYNVYRYNSTKKAYVLEKTVSKNSYTIKGLSIGENCKFRIRAYIKTTTGTHKGEYTYVSFITKPGNVTKVYVTSVTTSSYYLRWNKSNGANCYYVYKYDASNKKYKVIAKTANLYYKLSNLTPGKTEAYKVLPAITKNSRLYVKGNLTGVYKFATKPSTVSGLKVSAAGSNNITLKWNKLTYYSRYEIYRYDAANKKYILVGNTTRNSFTVKNLKGSTNYYFRIRAVRTLNGADYNGGFSSLVKARTK